MEGNMQWEMITLEILVSKVMISSYPFGHGVSNHPAFK